MKRKYLILYEYDDCFLNYEDKPVRNLTKYLETKLSEFNVKDVHAKIDPHITLKAAFYLKLSFPEKIINFFRNDTVKESIILLKEQKLISLLEDFCSKKQKSFFSIEGIKNFGEDVVYWDVKSVEMEKTSKELCVLLKNNFSEISLNKHEPLHPHITLAKEFDKNFLYLALGEINKRFKLSVYGQEFNHISLYVYKNDKYERVKRFNLRA